MTIFDELTAGLVTASPEETERVGTRLAAALPENILLALRGDLGAGKTTLVRGLARGLGISAAITSPTYTIYTIHKGRRQLVHMDAYRLSDAHELDNLTVDEFLERPFLIALEWPEHVPGFLDEYPGWCLDMEILPDHRHRIRLIQGARNAPQRGAPH